MRRGEAIPTQVRSIYLCSLWGFLAWHQNWTGKALHPSVLPAGHQADYSRSRKGANWSPCHLAGRIPLLPDVEGGHVLPISWLCQLARMLCPVGVTAPPFTLLQIQSVPLTCSGKAWKMRIEVAERQSPATYQGPREEPGERSCRQSSGLAL